VLNNLMVKTAKNLGTSAPIHAALASYGVKSPAELTDTQADDLTKKLEAM
jgi:hypothetical protein